MNENTTLAPLGDPPQALSNQFATYQPGPLETQPPPPVTPMTMLQVALAQGADLAKLEQLMALQERWEAGEARKAFVAAMAQFKLLPLRVVKRKRVHFAGKEGRADTDYKHATLADVCDVAVPALAAVGISHRWKTEQQTGGVIHVTCILTHHLGHEESATLFALADQSGGKNAIQAIVSTTTYLMRQTLKQVTGMAEADEDDPDDDGRAGGGPPPGEPPPEADPAVSEDQAANLEALLTEVGANRELFLKACKVEKLADIKARMYPHAVARLEERRRAQGAA